MPINDQSILTSVKKLLGIDESYTVFDDDIVMHINSTFGTLHQLGVGPGVPYFIEDKTEKWEEFLTTALTLNSVKSYIFVKVKLLFDPPATSFAIEALERQVSEFEWRLQVAAEEVGTDLETTQN